MNSSNINARVGISNGVNCDIIIPVWNEPEATRACLESVLRNTDFLYRLIIIDNGSQQQTRIFLDGLKDKFKDFTLIRNEQNIGFVKAINQGFKVSDADYACILNNDTIVTDGWLSEMVNIAENNFEVGIVNPSSNTLGQYAPKDKTVDDYALSLKAYKGKWGELGQCTGFCMLIKREVMEKLGIFDEAYEVGYFEEADYCRRAQKAGYIFARAKAAYVYHAERLTFGKRPDKEAIFEKNRKLFESRWGESLRIACVVSKPPKDAIDRDEMCQIVLTSAQDNHKVYVYIRAKLAPEFNFAEHSNILIFKFNDVFFPLISFLKIITKKPAKRFNLILSDGLGFYYFLKASAFIHKAKLMFSPHLERAIELSQKEAFKH